MGTSPALLGYDMVWAITQDTINSQLYWLFSNGIISDQVTFGDLDNDGLVFDGTIDVPEIDLIGGSSTTLASFTVTFLTGTLKYYNGFGRNAKVETINLKNQGWKLAFNVNLNMALLAENYKEQGKDVPPSIEHMVNNFMSSDFSVQHIFLDFQNSDLTTFDESRSNIPLTSQQAFLKSQFGTMLGAWIVETQGTSNPYILGYTATKDVNETSVFQPAGATYLIQKHTPAGSNDGLTALCFLMNTAGHEVKPPQLNFSTNLVESDEFSGTSLVSKQTVQEKWIEPIILPAFSHALGVDGVGWVQAAEESNWMLNYAPDMVKKTYKNADSGMVDVHAEYTQQTVCNVHVSTGEVDSSGIIRPAIVADGYFYRKAYFYENAFGIKKSVEARQSNKQPFTVRIFLVAGDDGQIQLRTEVIKGKMESSSHESALASIADVVDQGYGDTLKSVNNDFTRMENYNFDNMQSSIRSAFNTLQNAVILPAPSTFLYKDLSFTGDGDMKLHISYKS